MKNIIEIINRNQFIIIFIFVIFLSINIDIYFYQNSQHLLYGDALSRLNISRKIVDNLNPGFAQLGNVWLPVPQMLMLIFTWNTYFWHTGLAGTIVSGCAFILGAWFIYETVKMVTSSKPASLFGLLVYVLNINILYLQTTAMSESLFICLSAMVTYGLIGWTFTKKHTYLIFSALGVSLLTLTRYEGLAVLGSVIILVIFYSYITSRNKSKAEGDAILFSTLACLGFLLWTIYLWAIFGDPLYWKSYYADVQTPSSSVSVVVEKITYIEAFWKYITSMVWMNGLMPICIAFVGTVFALWNIIKKRNIYLIPFLIPFAVILFMVLTLHRNTTIDQPVLNMSNLLSNKTSFMPEFNIRYGLLMLPWIAILCGYLFSIKNILFRLFLILLLGFQVYSYFSNQLSLIYQLRLSISTNNTQGTLRDKELLFGLKKYYNGGLIMISALKHDPQMFQMGIDYKNYIHEGAGSYWKSSIKNPSKYADFVVLDVYNDSDQVTKYLKNSKQLKKKYSLIFDFEGMRIYKKN